jgi:hypothetical protein
MSSYYLHSLVYCRMSLQYSHDLRIPGPVRMRGSNHYLGLTNVALSSDLYSTSNNVSVQIQHIISQCDHGTGFAHNHTTGSAPGQHLAVGQWCLRGSRSQMPIGGIIKLWLDCTEKNWKKMVEGFPSLPKITTCQPREHTRKNLWKTESICFVINVSDHTGLTFGWIVLGVSHVGMALWVLIFLKEMAFLVGCCMILSVSKTVQHWIVWKIGESWTGKDLEAIMT